MTIHRKTGDDDCEARKTGDDDYDEKGCRMISHIRGWRSYTTTGLLTPLYSMGFCAGIMLGCQLVTGFVLACWYQPVGENVVPFGSGSVAFKSVDSIQRELDAG